MNSCFSIPIPCSPDKTPPASRLILKAAKVSKGSGVPNKEKVGTVSENDFADIANIKMSDLNANTVE